VKMVLCQAENELLASLHIEQHSRTCMCSSRPAKRMIRAPGICEFSPRIFVRCLLQMEEQRPGRMPVHSDMLGHAICMCLALYCSPLGHSLFLLRDLVVTLHRSRAHTSEVCCEATSCASRSHLFRTCLRQAQRAACPAAAGRGDGRRRSDEAQAHR
jgi:hypothetical protein